MEIRRALSQGVRWTVSLGQIPALLELIDEQQIPVDIRLAQATGTVSLHPGSLYCRRCVGSLVLKSPESLIRIELDQLAEARAVCHSAGARRRISLELLGTGGTALLTITGPAADAGHEAEVWRMIMEGLLPDPRRARVTPGLSARPAARGSERRPSAVPETSGPRAHGPGRSGLPVLSAAPAGIGMAV